MNKQPELWLHKAILSLSRPSSLYRQNKDPLRALFRYI